MRTAASGRGDRSYPPGSRPRAKRRRGGTVARGMARAGGRRSNSRGRPEPAWRVGPDGHDAVRSRTALFPLAVNAPSARDMVYADRMGRRALRAADRSSLVFAFGVSLGTHRRYDVGAVCGGASRRSNKAGLSGNSRSREETGANPQTGAEAGFGAVSRSRAPVARMERNAMRGRPLSS